MIYLDANVIIRLVEGTADARQALESRLRPAQRWMTSRLSRLECRCKPMRQQDQVLLDLYERFFSGSELYILELSAAVVERATELRASYNLRTPDAIHLASAIENGGEIFLTGDRACQRCSEITVEIL